MYTLVNDKTRNVQIQCPRFKPEHPLVRFLRTYFAVLCDRYAFRSKDVHASPLIFALSVACMIPDLPDCEVWLKEGPLAGLAHLFTLGTKPYHSVHCLPCVALQCTKRGPNASEGHDGRRLNQQNLYLLLITFAKCHPDTRSAILRVWVIAAAITGTNHCLLWTFWRDKTCCGEI